jgi:hypothetical protein
VTRLLHSLTHRHTQASKNGVATILICASRATGRWRASITPADSERPDWQPISHEQLSAVSGCTSPAEVRALLGAP